MLDYHHNNERYVYKHQYNINWWIDMINVCTLLHKDASECLG